MKAKPFVVFTFLCALVLTASLAYFFPPGNAWSPSTLFTLAILALTAELMVFLLPEGAQGSISFIPYMTTVLLVPNASGLIAILSARAIAGATRKLEPLKFIFNCSQLLLSYGVAIAI